MIFKKNSAKYRGESILQNLISSAPLRLYYGQILSFLYNFWNAQGGHFFTTVIFYHQRLSLSITLTVIKKHGDYS